MTLLARFILPGQAEAITSVLADLPTRYGAPVLTPISRSIRFAEAPAAGRSILATAPRSRGAAEYRAVADALDQEPSTA